jgi:prepilin-type N-terminal cleavage/methylation domain-containing protein
MKKLKNNNEGFTLVELLIAVIILAVVMAPLFRNFMESTKLNSKAKKAMSATNMASNMMEGMNAYSAEDIIIGFDSEDSRGNLRIFPDDITCDSHGEVTYDESAGTYTVGYTIEGSVATGTAAYVSGGSVSANSLSFVSSADKKYYLYAAGVQQNKTKYDVLVTLDASASSGFSGDTNGDGVIGSGETEGYNDYESIAITTMNPIVDSKYVDNSELWEDVHTTFAASSKNQWWSPDTSSVKSDTKREIIVTIDMDTSDPTMSASVVNVENKFTYQGGDYYYNREFSTNTQIFKSTTQYPRDIYLYYYPNYNSTSSGDAAKDQIKIVNNLGRDVTVHLIRVVPDGASDWQESSYRCMVSLEDTGDVNTKIYSNLKDNLFKTEEENASNYRKQPDRCRFKLNGVLLDDSDTRYKQIVTEGGGMVTEVSDRLYKMDVQVFEEGAAALGFPQDMRVAVYDGGSAKQ